MMVSTKVESLERTWYERETGFYGPPNFGPVSADCPIPTA